MINQELSDRLNAYIPEVLLTVTENIKLHMLDYINASVVSVDFAYVTSSETAESVLSASLSQECRQVCKIFAQNILRFGHQCNTDSTVLKHYFPENIHDLLYNQYTDLIALAYLNAGHGALIAASTEGRIVNVKQQ